MLCQTGTQASSQQASPWVEIPEVSPCISLPCPGLCPRAPPPPARLSVSSYLQQQGQKKCQRSANCLARSRARRPPGTHRACDEFWRVVIDVSHRDDGCGRVREAVVEVSLHVCGLNNDCVLLNFLERTSWGRTGLSWALVYRLLMLFIKGACSLGGACCSWASGQHEAHWPHGPPQTRSKAGGRTFSVGNRAAREPGRTPARRLWPLLVQIIIGAKTEGPGARHCTGFAKPGTGSSQRATLPDMCLEGPHACSIFRVQLSCRAEVQTRDKPSPLFADAQIQAHCLNRVQKER